VVKIRLSQVVKFRLTHRQVGIIVSEETYQQLIDTTDRLEISVSQFVRDTIEEKIKVNEGDKDV
jgi:hypothetical protein